MDSVGGDLSDGLVLAEREVHVDCVRSGGEARKVRIGMSRREGNRPP